MIFIFFLKKFPGRVYQPAWWMIYHRHLPRIDNRATNLSNCDFLLLFFLKKNPPKPPPNYVVQVEQNIGIGWGPGGREEDPNIMLRTHSVYQIAQRWNRPRNGESQRYLTKQGHIYNKQSSELGVGFFFWLLRIRFLAVGELWKFISKDEGSGEGRVVGEGSYAVGDTTILYSISGFARLISQLCCIKLDINVSRQKQRPLLSVRRYIYSRYNPLEINSSLKHQNPRKR